MHLARLKILAERIELTAVSDHLAWQRLCGDSANLYLYSVMPARYKKNPLQDVMALALQHLNDQIFARAYAHLRADRSLQFVFGAPPRSPTPRWITGLLNFLRLHWPVLKVTIWVGLAILALAILVFIIRAVMRHRHMLAAGRKAVSMETSGLAPSAVKARALLQEADSLAAEARFGEAAHLLLLRSIEEIQSRRPGLLRPALTSREIARLDAVPQAARDAFAALAQAVEKTLFGGREVDADAFADCRAIYEAFAFPTAWAGKSGG